MSDPYAKAIPSEIPAIDKQIEKEPIATAMTQILERAKERSADAFTLTREIMRGVRQSGAERSALRNHKGRAHLIVDMLTRPTFRLASSAP